ncbi:MAG: GNAT family N-acetyltransferase [Thomasclavelia sp.]|uniref:GNAT family N-acetyltransferase n=1 Tax=Thomasclavelia sp. TaxID=3025757 RepID=UPI0039A10B8B
MLKSKRLILRRPEIEDVEEILKIHNSEYVQRFNAMKIYKKEDMLKDIINDKDKTFYIQLIDSKKIIGAIFTNDDYLRYQVNAVCLSYYLAEEYHGQGYMFEALNILINDLFEQGKEIISARAFVGNESSKNLLLKLGFVLEGCLRKAVKGYKGIIYDDLVFSLLKDS